MEKFAAIWHAISAQNAVEQLSSSENGLDEKEAARRLEEFGPNKLSEKKKFSALKLVIEQFTGALVVVLVLAGIVSAFIGDYIEAGTIFAIIIINAVLGFFQEYKAEKALEALKKMTALNATVIRNGKTTEVDASTLVPGDIVVLHTGDKVPADIRLIESVNLQIDEAVLTGESKPVSKTITELAEKLATAEKKNMAFANTIVTYGRGKGIVVGTGEKTEFGKIANLLKEIPEEDTPLKRKLERLGQFMIKIVVGIIALLFVIGIIEGTDIHEMFKIAISLGVAAIPEGLPAVITITLSIGVLQMAQKNALTKRMPAVEALGAATVICSDKTGTLTRNEMVAEKIYANGKLFTLTGNGYDPKGEFLFEGKTIDTSKEKELSKLLEIAVECNDAEILVSDNSFSISGDPTEGSLVVAAEKAGIKRALKRLDEIQFDSERKMMTTIHEIDGKKVSYTKGAVEKMIMLSDRLVENGKFVAFSDEKKKQVSAEAEKLAKQAYRILGFAFREIKSIEEAEKNMAFAGFACLNDPPREGVKEAIQTALSAGIKVKMLTGDNAITASAIAQKLGFGEPAITGNELDELNEQEFYRVVREKTVFARISPEHKLKIVSALKAQGEIVAVTGDGVNDAPALKKSDIGIAMGIKGTDVSKEAADLILKDDNFATIVVAIREGRKIYDNIKNFVKYLLAANIGEVMIIALAIILNFALPILPLQLLWLNIVTDSLPALALGTESSTKNQMERKPRKTNENILDDIKSFIFITGIVATIVVFISFFYGLSADIANGATLEFLNSKEGFDFESKARTMAFTTLVVFELFFVFSCRHQNTGIFSDNPFTNKFLVKMVLVSFALQVLVIYLPEIIGINVFTTVELGLVDWLVVFALAATSAFVPYIDNAVKKILAARQTNKTVSLA